MRPILAAAIAALSLPAQDPASGIPDDTEIKTTLTGLRYSVLRAGEGASPRVGDRVTIHYTGWLGDGTKFDSSRDRGEPMTHPVGRFVPGWNEALQLMKPGSRWKLTIPPALGYGERGAPPAIPPNATLIFDVELLSFEARPRPPEYRAPDPTAQETTAGGTRYEVVTAAAEGARKPAAGDLFELGYTLWDTSGKLLESSVPDDGGIAGSVAHMSVPFLKEVPLLMGVGATWLVEVPAMPPGPAQVPLLKQPTVWLVTMRRVLAVPAFQRPPDDELQRTDSGLRYRVLESAGEEARKVENGQALHVHYAGWLEDGTKFDASYDRGQPYAMRYGPEAGVIAGWIEGLGLMREGDTYLLVIPPELGYGAAGRPPVIPGGATLVFAVHVYRIVE